MPTRLLDPAQRQRLGRLRVQQASARAETPETLHCDFKAMSACSPDGSCKEGAEVPGIKMPVKVTVDFENGVVAAVDETGYARTDKVRQHCR